MMAVVGEFGVRFGMNRDMEENMACLWQKMYPGLYHCGPQENIYRVK